MRERVLFSAAAAAAAAAKTLSEARLPSYLQPNQELTKRRFRLADWKKRLKSGRKGEKGFFFLLRKLEERRRKRRKRRETPVSLFDRIRRRHITPANSSTVELRYRLLALHKRIFIFHTLVQGVVS